MADVQTRESQWRRKVVEGLSAVTVEPILFFFIFGSALIFPCVKDLVYVKVCLSHFNKTVCDNIADDAYTEQEDVVQAESSIWYLKENLCFEIPSILIAFYYGAMSDRVSRKLALLMPAVGQVLSSINYLINAAVFDLPVSYILIGPLISGLFGGWITCVMASFSYLSDISRQEWRTVRIAIGESMISASIAISYFSGGTILDNTSFVFVLSLALSMYVIVIIYTLIRIKELPIASHLDKPLGCCNRVATIIHPRRIKEALAVVVKKRTLHRRRHIIIMLICTSLSLISSTPSEALGYLYLKRHPLAWSQSLYGYFQGYRTVVRGVFVIVVVPILIRKKLAREAAIIAVAFASSSLAEVAFGVSTKTWMIFLVPLVGMMGDAQWTCVRSLLSQSVEKHEYGQIFAVFGSLQSASILIGATIYNNMYPATLHFWVGFCFVVGASVAVFPIGLMLYVNHDMKKQGTYQEIEDENVVADGDDETLAIQARGQGLSISETKEFHMLTPSMDYAMSSQLYV